MKTSVYLDDELESELATVQKLVKERPATILRMAIREGFKVLIKRLTPNPEEPKKKPDSK